MLIVQLMCMFLLVSMSNTFAITDAKAGKISVSKKNANIKEVFKDIEAQSEFSFIYREKDLDLNKKMDIDIQNESIQNVMSMVLENQKLTFKIDNKIVIILPKKDNQKKEQLAPTTIKGRVVDENGDSLPGVTIVEKGTQNGVITDIDGAYSIVLTSANPILLFSFVGMQSEEVLVSNQSTINVTIKNEDQGLDEVVVTALGIKRKEKSLGYAVQKIKGEEFTIAKGTNIATNLTGKVAGLLVKNSTEFGESPTINLRGSEPLIVVDGVAYSNMNLNSISADDIASIDILKGATAAALYGVRGRKGALMITTFSGSEKDGKIKVNVSSNTMVQAGYLKIPERQTSYSSGISGNFNNDDYVWGAYMDGHMENQYNPITKEYEDMPLLPRGKDNLKNFLENSFITNNNISVSQSGKLGGFRVSGTQIHNKGDYPNTHQDKYIFNIGGNIEYNKLKIDASMNYSKEKSPNIPDRDYGSQNIIYNMMIWTGSEYDIRDYKDYWVRKDIEQSWQWSSWYDNPYFLMKERINSEDKGYLTGKIAINYQLHDKLGLTFRTGYDSYDRKYENRRAMSTRNSRRGSYDLNLKRGYSFSNDLLLNSNLKWKDFNFDLLGGLSSYYYEDESLRNSTKGGLSVPGFYSLSASVESPNVSRSINHKMLYGVYAKAGISYKNIAYIDITGRNDWSSTLPSESRSYFYPSISGSLITSELFNPIPDVLDFMKFRGSWAVAKSDLGVYSINKVYSIDSDVWDGLSTASYPSTLRAPGVKAETERTYEFGMDLRFFKNRLAFDVSYFNRLQYNRLVNAGVSDISGFSNITTNTKEERVQKGMEFTLSGKLIKKENFTWDAVANLAYNHWYYNKLDPDFSSEDPRIKKGARVDAYFLSDFERDNNGNLVLYNGLTRKNNFKSNLGTSDPKFFWGFTNNLSYKRFQLSFSFDGRVGGLMYNWTNQALWNTGAHPDSDNEYRYEEYVNGNQTYIAPGVKVTSGEVKYDPYGAVISDTRVFAENDQVVSYGQYIRKYQSNAYTAESQNVMDPTFIKLRELAINYKLPTRVAEKMGMKDLTVGLIGQNLWIWTKEFKFSDPDRGKENLNSPAKRYVGVNVNMTF